MNNQKCVVVGAALGLVILAACVPQPPEAASGHDLYQSFCQSCHGDKGKGDGPLAAGLPKKPADLTGIAQRNGGQFPLAKVMSTIDGYTRRNDHGSIMPEMGPMLQDGPMMMVDTGDGIETPVPAPLLALAGYLRGLQVK
jgi:mono/diheme cytochrome c family protein